MIWLPHTFIGTKLNLLDSMFMSSGGNMCLRKSLKIQTVSSSPHNWPNITFFDKQSAETKFINVSIPGDSRISQKSVEKRDRYCDLSVIVSRLWNTSTFVVPVIVGALGSIPINLHQSLNSIGLPSTIIPVIQKSVLLSTSRILRHYLF